MERLIGGSRRGSSHLWHGLPTIPIHRFRLPARCRSLGAPVGLGGSRVTVPHSLGVRADLVQFGTDNPVLDWPNALADQVHDSGYSWTVCAEHLPGQPGAAVFPFGYRTGN